MAKFHLTNGEVGDDTAVDGEIFDIGGPGFAAVIEPVPAPAPGARSILRLAAGSLVVMLRLRRA